MRKRDFLIGIFFVCTALFVTFPAVLSIGSKIIGDSGDTYQFLGFQYIAKREFFAGRFPFGWTDFWRYPYGIHAESIMDSSLFTIMGLWWYSFTSNPILVYNLSVLSMIIFNLAVSYLAFRMKFRRLVSVLASIMYGLSFYAIGKLGGHMNLFSLSGFSLCFFSVLKLYESHGRLRYFLLSGLSTLIIAFSSLQYPLFFVGGLPFLIPLLLIFYRKESLEFILILWKKKISVILTLCMIFAVFLPFHGHKLEELLAGDVPMPVFHIVTVPILDFLIPNTYLKTLIGVVPSGSKEWIDYTLPFGYIELTLFIIAIFALRRSRHAWFLLSGFSIFFLLALGVQDWLPQLWPYQYLFPHFPYRGITEPGRFFIIFYLMATVVVALYLTQIKNIKILILIIVLLLVERIPIGFQLSPNQYDPEFIVKVKEPPSRAILDLPIQVDWWNGQMYDIYSVYYEKPIVNGYVQWSGNFPISQTLVKELEPYTCYPEPQYAPKDFDQNSAERLRDDLIRQMRFYDIHTVVLHKDLNIEDEHCTRAKRYIDVLLADQSRWLEVYQSDKKLILWLKD